MLVRYFVKNQSRAALIELCPRNVFATLARRAIYTTIDKKACHNELVAAGLDYDFIESRYRAIEILQKYQASPFWISDHKTCTKCRRVLTKADFHRRSKGSPDGLYAQCKACRLKHGREYDKERRNRPERIVYMKVYGKAYRKRPYAITYMKAYMKTYYSLPGWMARKIKYDKTRKAKNNASTTLPDDRRTTLRRLD